MLIYPILLIRKEKAPPLSMPHITEIQKNELRDSIL
jgi:hypothetical protein